MKPFMVTQWVPNKDITVERGLHRLGQFKDTFGHPIEKKVFKECYVKSRFYICRVEKGGVSWYIYQSSLEELKREYFEIIGRDASVKS